MGHPLAFPSLAPRASVWVGWGRHRAALSQTLDQLIKTQRGLSQVDQPYSVTCSPKRDKKLPDGSCRTLLQVLGGTLVAL